MKLANVILVFSFFSNSMGLSVNIRGSGTHLKSQYFDMEEGSEVQEDTQ